MSQDDAATLWDAIWAFVIAAARCAASGGDTGSLHDEQKERYGWLSEVFTSITGWTPTTDRSPTDYDELDTTIWVMEATA